VPSRFEFEAVQFGARSEPARSGWSLTPKPDASGWSQHPGQGYGRLAPGDLRRFGWAYARAVIEIGAMDGLADVVDAVDDAGERLVQPSLDEVLDPRQVQPGR